MTLQKRKVPKEVVDWVTKQKHYNNEPLFVGKLMIIRTFDMQEPYQVGDLLTLVHRSPWTYWGKCITFDGKELVKVIKVNFNPCYITAEDYLIVELLPDTVQED